MKKKIFFVANAGGHLFQLLKLKPIYSDYDYTLITEKNGVTKELKNEYNTFFMLADARKNFLSTLIKFPINIFLCLAIVLWKRPDVVITTGSNLGVIFCYAAKLIGKKTIFIESFARSNKLSLSGRLLYKKVDVFLVQHEKLHLKYKDTKYIGGVY